MNLELLKSFTILYVEDEKSLQEDIYQNILPFVKKVITASDGEEGLSLYSQNKNQIDLIISDILMPKMNGIEMVDEIRKLDTEIPIIYTTAFSDSDYMRRTIEQSITGYIIKPIDIELLLKSISKASLKIENEKLKISLQNINQDLEKKVDLKTKELQFQNEKLYQQLYTDDLTNLPNRKALFRDISKIDYPALALIDIDSFKNINDLYGEEIGNEVLKSVAKILKEFTNNNGSTCYRMGADEFAVLRNIEFSQQKCIDIINSIQATINSHSIFIKQYNIKIRIDATIGVSDEKVDTQKKANMALKKAKKKRLPFLIYSKEHNLNIEHANDIKWTKIMTKAITDDNIVPYYQPIVDENQNIVKYESLMRIIEGENIYSPFLFLDISKKVKLYSKLEKKIILESFKKAKESGVQISVNLSIEDIVNSDFINFIEKELLKYDIANLITFEILEGENITDYEKVIDFINMIKKLGCTIAIDDFGSGYSNFVYLLKLKPDYIKIDGSSVKNIHKDKNAYLIVKTINDFAHNLGMKTIAEFVHCKEVFDLLKELGVDKYQGYYFSEPLKDF